MGSAASLARIASRVLLSRIAGGGRYILERQPITRRHREARCGPRRARLMRGSCGDRRQRTSLPETARRAGAVRHRALCRTARVAGERSLSMTWRGGEVWLDAELSWFREAPAVAAVAAPLPSFGSPPGLVASRVRRAAWKQRREARRARATAVALSPAVMLAIAGLRSGGGPASVVEDPPRLELTLGAGPGRALRELHPIPRAVGAADLERAIAAKAKAAPTI